MLIINADDWGRSLLETNAAFVAFTKGRISSVSAMVYMEDSVRAADLAKKIDIDVGLHLNLSQKFSGNKVPTALADYQESIIRFLSWNKYSLLLYNPFLRKHFKYTFNQQLNEFIKLYGKRPSHINGHQHFHLCSNMLFDKIIERGEKVRRSFSFLPGEKHFINRAYRRLVDISLTTNFRITDFFFDLTWQYKKDQLKRVCQLAKFNSVELMTHPSIYEDQAILSKNYFIDLISNIEIGTYASL